ncbi:MAG: hypothetical protein U9O83_02895 [Campylobacterota bacterium]|nr:hypothetical protein [Campylobacterota bacterium]
MNVIAEVTYTNGYFKPDYKDKTTGEITLGDYVVQGQQKRELSNGSIQLENLDIPVDRSMSKMFEDKKVGDLLKVPCNVYGENFAQIKIGKAKK